LFWINVDDDGNPGVQSSHVGETSVIDPANFPSDSQFRREADLNEDGKWRLSFEINKEQ
jgi:hypothetical protein